MCPSVVVYAVDHTVEKCQCAELPQRNQRQSYGRDVVPISVCSLCLETWSRLHVK